MINLVSLLTSIGLEGNRALAPNHTRCHLFFPAIKTGNTMHQSIPAVQSHSRELRGICAFRGWGIRNFIMSRRWGICVPRGDPWAFDTHGFRNWHGGIYQPGWGVCGRLASLLRSRQIVFLNFRYSSSLVNLIKNNNLSNLWHSSTYNVASDEHILLGTMEQLGVKLWI